MPNNSIISITNNELCTGCGVCVSESNGNLKIKKNEFGFLVPELINLISLQSTEKKEIALNATELVEILRLDKNPGVMEVFLAEYGLSNDEGISLMCLAEALLRVPDVATIDSLIKDKLTNRGWVEHIGNSESTLVNASTWALMLTGKVLKNTKEPKIYNSIHSLIKKFGEPFIRKAVRAVFFFF